MKMSEHPTWRMLEQEKKKYRDMLDKCPKNSYLYIALEQAHTAMVKLQYAVEGKIYRQLNDGK